MREPKNKENRKTATVKEFAAEWGLGINAAYAALHRKEIPSIRIGGKLLIPRAALDRLLEAK